MINFIDKAKDLINEKKFEDAKNLLESNLSHDSDDVEALKLLGLCNVNLKCTNQAIETFNKVIKIAPSDATSWFYLATMYDDINNVEKAEIAYRKVISLREEYVDAHKQLAILYLKHRKTDKALPYAEQTVKLDPLDYQGYYLLGTIATAKKDFETAVVNYEKAIALNQSSASIFNSLGAAYFATNRLDEALKAFNNALLLDETNPTTHYHMGNIAQIKKSYNEAFKHFQIAYNNEPSPLNLSALAYCALKAEKYDDALTLYKTLCIIHPEKQNFQYNLACVYLALKNYKDAITILKKLVMMNPKSAAMAEKLAEVFVAVGQVEDAKLVYELLIRKGKVTAEVYYRYALICRQSNDMDKAIKIFKKVIELDPKNAVAHKDLGVIYLIQRLFDYAQDEFEIALKLVPEDLNINFEFANFLYATGDYIAAKALFERIRDKMSDNSPFYFYQGLNYLALNELENALIAFEKSYQIEPNDLNKYHLARTNFHLENYNTCIDMLNELDTLDVDALNLMALAFYETKKYEKAIDTYKKILEKFNENMNIMLSLSKCYLKAGKKEEALDSINSILKRFSDHEEALALKQEAEAL